MIGQTARREPAEAGDTFFSRSKVLSVRNVMSIMIEIYYRKPASLMRESAITSILANHDGDVTFRETDSADSICLTAEFTTWERARAASTALREAGEHVEGP